MKRGLQVAFEGIEGCGKTTQAENLFSVLRDLNIPVSVYREPGGTPSAEGIRYLILHSGLQFQAITEALLMNAARAELLVVIRGELARGVTVISDRTFLSTICYQGYGAGSSAEEVEVLRQMCALTIGQTVPDITLVIDVPVAAAFARIKDKKPDYFEKRPREFHERVRQGFLKEAARNSEVNKVINGELAPEIVADHVLDIAETLLHGRGLLNNGG